MKVVIFSDSHGTYDNMMRIVKLEKPELILYLGDGLRDAAAVEGQFPDIPMYKVYGNCDIMPPKSVPANQEILICGYRVFMTHGHLYSVKTGLYEIMQEGRDRGADLLLFGHTHKALCEHSGSMWVCNPGSMSPMSGEHYAVATFEEAGIMISLKQA